MAYHISIVNALCYPEFGRLTLEDRPTPVPLPDEVLLRVAACGVCGSELESFRNRSPRRPPPLVMGHEFCGTVVEAGSLVSLYKPGDRVISHSMVHCGECPRCLQGRTHLCAHRQIFGMHRPGAFAERVCVPERVLIPWPDSLAPSEAAFAEPLANGVHVVNLTRHLPVDTVLLIGAGPIGLMCQLAMQTLRGARFLVSEPNAMRRAVSLDLGGRVPGATAGDSLIKRVLEATDGEGVDLVIDAVGSVETKRQSIACARPGGAAVWIGLHEDEMTLSSYAVALSERQIFGSYAATMDELRTAADLLGTKRVDVSALADVYPLSDGIRGFESAVRGQSIKSVILPS